MAKVFLPGVDAESRKRWRLADDDPGPVSLPKMLFKEDEARRQDRVGQPPKSSAAAFPGLRPRQQRAPSSEPTIVRWAREQRESDALRKQFPGYVPTGPKGPPKSSYPAVLPERMKAFLRQQDPSVDWSKVVTRIGGNWPGSYASTDGNLVSFSEPLRKTRLIDFFHEMAHIPDWQDGTLTTPKYVGQAILSAGRFAAKTAANYGMHASHIPPISSEKSADSIWEDISYERAANKRAEEWYEAWHEAKRPPSK